MFGKSRVENYEESDKNVMIFDRKMSHENANKIAVDKLQLSGTKIYILFSWAMENN